MSRSQSRSGPRALLLSPARRRPAPSSPRGVLPFHSFLLSFFSPLIVPRRSRLPPLARDRFDLSASSCAADFPIVRTVFSFGWSGGAEGAADGERDALPIFRFGLELAPARFRQAVEFRAPIVLRFAPLGFEPAGFLRPMERGEERARFHVERALGYLVDAGGYAEPVKRLGRQRFEDKQVERALKEIGGEFVLVAHIDD